MCIKGLRVFRGWSEKSRFGGKTHKKARPAIDKAGGISYTGFSGTDCRPNHEYMRDKLTYSPTDIVAFCTYAVKLREIAPSEKNGGFFYANERP